MVGDYIQLRDTINSNVYESLSKKGWPKRVDSISKCNNMDELPLHGPECAECPGYINGECYGYGEGYAVERIDTDWDK